MDDKKDFHFLRISSVLGQSAQLWMFFCVSREHNATGIKSGERCDANRELEGGDQGTGEGVLPKLTPYRTTDLRTSTSCVLVNLADRGCVPSFEESCIGRVTLISQSPTKWTAYIVVGVAEITHMIVLTLRFRRPWVLSGVLMEQKLAWLWPSRVSGDLDRFGGIMQYGTGRGASGNILR